MEIVREPEAIQSWARAVRAAGRTIGFVPTMGYLHEGHLSLMRIAKAEADAVVVSIFVNPIQFGPREDFRNYPRDFARDESLCREVGVDAIFYPTAESMYPPDFSVYVEETAMSGVLCGASRPGHFRGVTTVVAKLFNLVGPDVAVFGEKDAQQVRIIRRMVRDLNFPIRIISAPTAREADGLAMSSRNVLLTPEERAGAPWLRRALLWAQEQAATGECDAAALLAGVRERAARSGGVIDYVALVDDETLKPLAQLDRRALLALAVRFSVTRLIDNIVLEPSA